MTASQASKEHLAFVNSAGNAIIKVDNTTNNLQIKQDRNSVNIATKDYFAMGSVWVADMLHVPYGVSHHIFLMECGASWYSSHAALRARRWTH